MSSSRDTLERIGARVPIPQPAFDRMMRRRDRRVRNRRIGSAVVALLLAALAIGGAIRVIGGAERQVPANPGSGLDPSFGSSGVVTTSISGQQDEVHAIAIQPDGRVVVAGGSGDDAEFALARYNTDGTLDTTFGNAGTVTTDFTTDKDVAFDLAIQADGKIVAAGAAGLYNAFALARYNTDGTLDTTFGNGGKVTMHFAPTGSFARNVAIQDDGKIVVAGPSSGAGAADFALARFNADGTLDTSFGGDGTVTTAFKNRDDPWDMMIQPDGKVLAAGYGAGSFALARYDADGTLDLTFGTDGQVADIGGAAFGVAMQANGKIVLMGTTTDSFALARYRFDGSLDRSFGERGLVTSATIQREAGGRIAISPNGEIVTVAAGPGFRVVRFLRDGTPDTSFGTNGISTIDFGSGSDASLASVVTVGADDRIYAAGSATRSTTDSDFAVVRYLSTARPAPTSSSSSAPTFVLYLGLAVLVVIYLFVRARRRTS